MRVSSADDRQTVDLQRDALVAAGVDHRHLHTDKASGARDGRPGLKACLEYLNPGDTLIVWKLDRLGRSLPHLLAIVTDLKTRGIAFRSLTEQMDTTTPHGELLFSLFGALAQYERALTRERVMAGLAAAKRRGRKGGRPPMIDTETLERITAALDGGPARLLSVGPSRYRARHSSARWPGLAGPHQVRPGRSHQAVCRQNTTLSRIGFAGSPILSDML
jgi:DNA invertase Pin-like site-specific DNA recombinase